MSKIVVLSYLDVDITEGISELIHRYPENPILVAAIGHSKILESVIESAKIHETPFSLVLSEMSPEIEEYTRDAVELFVAEDPHAEILKMIDHGDVIGFVWEWDEIAEIDEDRRALEDFGVDQWDITEGIDSMDDFPLPGQEPSDSPTEALGDAFAEWMEALSEFISWRVKEAVDSAFERGKENLLRTIEEYRPKPDDKA